VAVAASRIPSNRTTLIAAGALGALLLLAGVIVIVKNRHGEETARIAAGRRLGLVEEDGRSPSRKADQQSVE